MLSSAILNYAEHIRTNSVYPEIVKVEYDKNDILLPTPARIAKQLRKYILAQTVKLDQSIFFCGNFRFDGSVEADIFHRAGHKEFAAVKSVYYNNPQENLATFEWQHATANFAKVIDGGMSLYIAEIDRSMKRFSGDPEKLEYLQAMRDTCETIILWAHKCADACEAEAAHAASPRRERLLMMADTLRHVPEHPARNFREGVQAVFLCFTFLPDSLGLIDRYLYKLYTADIERGVMTREEAANYIAELFIRICGHTEMSSTWAGDKGAESHFAIGGTLPDGSDGYTALSDLIVDTMMEFPLPRPQTSLRITRKTPYEVVKKLLDCARKDYYMRFAFVGDEPRIKGICEIAKISWDDAINYTMVGCNEPALRGSIWYGGCTTNIARSLTNTLYDRTADAAACRDFDEFFALYEEELEKDINRIIYYIDGFNTARARDCNVLSSIFIDGCIESATPVNRCGGRLSIAGSNMMGLVCVIDSLSIIRQLVFDEERVTMTELIEILRSDWAGENGENLRIYIQKKGRFFGNDDELSDSIARRFTDALWRHTKDKTDQYGNHFLVGTLAGYNPHFAFFGALTDATPDGRHKGDAFMVGCGQTAGKDRNGLTALLSSVASMDEHKILAGPFLCNAYLEENLIMDDDNFEKTVQIIYQYFISGGMHVQLNYVSKEQLLAARENPADWSSLRVRVSGFSGNFTRLHEKIQDDIIRRTVIEK